LSVDRLVIGCCLNLGLSVLANFFRISLNNVLGSLEHIRKFLINNIKIFDERAWAHRSVSLRILCVCIVLSSHLRIKHLHTMIEPKIVWLKKVILLLKIKIW
jgi:hypothetical protein